MIFQHDEGAMKEKIYIKFTTKEYREEKELAYLNRKVITNIQQMANMEQLIQKKSELLAARRVTPPPSHAPSAPLPPSAPLHPSHPQSGPPAPPRASSISLDTPDTIQAQAEVHMPPNVARPSTSAKTVVHRK